MDEHMGTDSVQKRVPLSLEDLLQKKKQSEEPSKVNRIFFELR